MLLPDIRFVPFESGATEKDLIEYMSANYEESTFLVYLRCRYEHEKLWEYIIDACCLCNSNDILWMNDWFEGQQHVEYLGITQIN